MVLKSRIFSRDASKDLARIVPVGTEVGHLCRLYVNLYNHV